MQPVNPSLLLKFLTILACRNVIFFFLIKVFCIIECKNMVYTWIFSRSDESLVILLLDVFVYFLYHKSFFSVMWNGY